VNRPIRGVWHDSRKVGPRDLFVAIRGGQIDGRRFAKGLQAAAVIADGPVEVAGGVTVIEVADTRQALARAAAALAGHPARDVPVVALTGTNGKTTTTWLIEAAAQAAGVDIGVIGTTGHRIAGVSRPAALTTPEAPVVQQLLSEARDAGCGAVVIETSSIGLALRRVDAIPFRVGVFTSFSRDHLGFHGDMARYRAAKDRLFTELLDPQGRALLSADVSIPVGVRAPVWTYGAGPPGAGSPGVRPTCDIQALDITADLSGTTARVITPAGEASLSLRLIGPHNLDNALAALGVGLALGWPLPRICAGLGALESVPGRLERVNNDQGITILVDYAHTPDALTQVLAALAPLVPGRMLAVFGCGGDRDAGKRPQMGAAASRGSDRVYVTSDNPRSEDPDAIIKDILPGVSGPRVVTPDRAAAIARAVGDARPGDLVLIAGKGHETVQIVGDAVTPFDDRLVARDALRSRALDRRQG